MGSLPSVKRWYAEDYKESPGWFSRFIGQLNLFAEPIYNLLNGGIVVGVNTTEEIYTLQIQNSSAIATGNTFLFTPKKFVGKPNGVLVGQCLYNTTSGVPTAVGNPVDLDWVWTGSQISILAIYGLSNTLSYTLSLRIY
jgi:hypothetical protein